MGSALWLPAIVARGRSRASGDGCPYSILSKNRFRIAYPSLTPIPRHRPSLPSCDQRQIITIADCEAQDPKSAIRHSPSEAGLLPQFVDVHQILSRPSLVTAGMTRQAGKLPGQITHGEPAIGREHRRCDVRVDLEQAARQIALKRTAPHSRPYSIRHVALLAAHARPLMSAPGVLGHSRRMTGRAGRLHVLTRPLVRIVATDAVQSGVPALEHLLVLLAMLDETATGRNHGHVRAPPVALRARGSAPVNSNVGFGGPPDMLAARSMTLLALNAVEYPRACDPGLAWELLTFRLETGCMAVRAARAVADPSARVPIYELLGLGIKLILAPDTAVRALGDEIPSWPM